MSAAIHPLNCGLRIADCGFQDNPQSGQGGARVHDSLSPVPPAWVYKRDGQLVPFDADKISRALFAATEALGRPDAFLARELADGVVHFLAADADGPTLTTAQVAELVEKVVRELGHPALAAAYAVHHTGRVPAPGPSAEPPRSKAARSP